MKKAALPSCGIAQREQTAVIAAIAISDCHWKRAHHGASMRTTVIVMSQSSVRTALTSTTAPRQRLFTPRTRARTRMKTTPTFHQLKLKRARQKKITATRVLLVDLRAPCAVTAVSYTLGNVSLHAPKTFFACRESKMLSAKRLVSTLRRSCQELVQEARRYKQRRFQRKTFSEKRERA